MHKELSKQVEKYLETRPATDEDKNFILDAWLSGFRRSKYAGCIPNNLFNRVYSTAIQQLLDRGMEILVLAAKAETNIDQKLGFVAFELQDGKKPVVHWIYVKEEFRGRKFSNYLLEKASVSPSEGFFYTFRTSYSRYYRKGDHRPAMARRKSL